MEFLLPKTKAQFISFVVKTVEYYCLFNTILHSFGGQLLHSNDRDDGMIKKLKTQ